MSEKIKPALTPEQWDEFLHRADGWGDSDPVTGISPSADGYYKSEWVGDHGTAAACLYGQPFGFTHEDVRQLRRMAESRVCHGHGEYGPPDMYERAMGGWRGLNDLADRIEALLPPEGMQ